MILDPATMIRYFLACGVLLGVVLGTPVRAQEAPSLASLQQQYDSLEALRASFVQVTSSEFASDSTRIEGTVLLSGERYRVESPSQTVVTDGQTTWIYSPVDSQVVVNDAAAEASTLTPETFLSAATQHYRVDSTRTAGREGTPHHVLDLQSTAPSTRFREATLWVRQSDRVVTRLQATDRNGSTLDLRLHDIVVNPPVGANAFTFSSPAEVEVIDLRSQAQD